MEKETLKIISIRERRKGRHKFGGTKACKAEEVRKYFVNPTIEIEVFSYIICSLYFKKYLMCSLFIAYENDEWCRFMVHIGSLSLISFYCVFRFFLLFSFFS